jgi:Zn-dependent protease
MNDPAVTPDNASALEPGEVLAELRRLERQTTGWSAALLILVFSLALFLGIGSAQWSWEIALLLVPILLVHELGHGAAMRVFKYRNVRLLFIPFFGAAVTGRHYNVPGWKKAVVSLMGPAPGIALGTALGLAGLALAYPLLVQGAILMLIINGFNLLPVLPLDGGWIAHTVLFSRHYLLDCAFRGVAALALLVAGTWQNDPVFILLGLFMAAGLPLAYRLAVVAARLRQRGVAAAPLEDETIPAETARAIIHELTTNARKPLAPKIIARQTLHVFETLNARPPRWPASFALMAAHLGCLLAAAGMVGFMAGQSAGGLSALRDRPRHPVICGSLLSWPGEASWAAPAEHTLVAMFSHRWHAGRAYRLLTNRVPAGASVTLFGDTVLLALPATDSPGRQRWAQELRTQATNVVVASTNGYPTFSLTCLAPSASAADALQAEAQEYFAGSGDMRLIPPWQARDTRGDEERARHRLARQTYAKLDQANARRDQHPALATLQQKIREALRREDPAEAARLRGQRARCFEDLEREYLDKIRAEGKAVDAGLVDCYAALSGTNAYQATEALQQMARRMGQLPPAEDLAPGDRYSTRWGRVARRGLRLTFYSLSFTRVADGPPALVDWLCRQGCTQIKYDLRPGGSPARKNEPSAYP